MFSWLKSEVLGMPGTDYLVLSGVLVAGLGFLFYYAYGAFKRFRFMHGTATSKIRSAAQGHVELKGLGEWLPDGAIESPFSKSRCVWYHCTIDKKRRSGKRTSWVNIEDQCSGHLFRLVDDTGDCVIDPDDAHVIPESDQTWYGHGTEYRSQPPRKNSWISLSLGNYRFRERLIRPATPLYALGWFRTVHNNPTEESISAQAEDLIKQWKLQPERYLRDFDFDRNGKIQQGEWKAIRAAARKQVLGKINDEKSEHHVMSLPKDKRQPYILSALDEETLVVRKKWKAYGSITGAFLIFSLMVILFSIRTPFPI